MPPPHSIAFVAGVIPHDLRLPGGIEGRQRTVRITAGHIAHIVERRPDWALSCLELIPAVLADPTYLGYRAHRDPIRVEFVRPVGRENRLLIVAVKFLDAKSEAWVCTAHPMHPDYLTRRLRAGTMREVGRGP